MRSGVDVYNYLVEREVAHEVVPGRGRFGSPERIAAVLDLPPAEVGKVMVFEGGDRPVAAVVPSDCVADPDAVAKAAGLDGVDAAGEARTSELTGYLAEAVPPAGLPSEFAIVMDASLDRDDVLYFPGGEVRAVLKIRGTDLVRATGATVASIAHRA